ncbi:N4-gp56 family major capsid protein [Pseudothauera rhizosphaerae]|uniref:N4-gp56 family major capsid protein n=1 Tax=Pseudothauera rhizosphaerae TaxID=2565932 RepID=A0A4V3W9N5_9RHOO|nr:N4-gp56 family major capsid protein [Pseudothauera rhizosphaerae]THF55921.1 N4-gp56 family major capsid protein [Pseudothauera rhizosphaerae]
MVGQVWLTNTLGGYMYSDSLSKVLRHSVQPLVKFRQFADIKDAAVQGKGKGDTFHWNVYSDVATQGTTLVETNTLPETNFTITQGTMTITEYGNSVPYTGKLDDLSEQPVKEVINKVLKNDAKKAFDVASHAQFNATPLRVAPYGGTSTDAIVLTTNGTATETNNVALGADHVKAIVDTMKERNIPPYTGDDYICLAHPSTLRDFKNELEDIHKYTPEGFGMILNGEIGRYENTRFVEQTNIAKEGWANAKSEWAFFFGNDTVAEGVAIPEEMRGKIPTDYGRSKGIAWYYLGGFGIVHPLNAADNSKNTRIVKWDSAA